MTPRFLIRKLTHGFSISSKNRLSNLFQVRSAAVMLAMAPTPGTLGRRTAAPTAPRTTGASISASGLSWAQVGREENRNVCGALRSRLAELAVPDRWMLPLCAHANCVQNSWRSRAPTSSCREQTHNSYSGWATRWTPPC